MITFHLKSIRHNKFLDMIGTESRINERKEKSNVRYKLRERQELKNLAKIDKALPRLQSKFNIIYDI